MVPEEKKPNPPLGPVGGLEVPSSLAELPSLGGYDDLCRKQPLTPCRRGSAIAAVLCGAPRRVEDSEPGTRSHLAG